MEVTVLANQSLQDIAVQVCGSVLSVFDLALLNGISVTENLVPGTKLKVPKSEYTDVEKQRYFLSRQIATSVSQQQLSLITQPGGIGAMSIGGNFIVS